MTEKVLTEGFLETAKSQGESAQPVVRDYLMGLTASALSEVYNGEARQNEAVPVLIGGIALKKGYLIDFPRYTTDIDYSTQRTFFEGRGSLDADYYGDRMQDAASIVREKVNSVYGSGAMSPNGIIMDIERRLVRGGPLATLRTHIKFPRFLKYDDLKIKVETNTTRTEDGALPPRVLPLLHRYGDAAELDMGTLTVEDIRKIHSDKLFALMDRLSDENDMAKTSRMKDIFDIWYISQFYQNDRLPELFDARVQRETKRGANIDEIEKTMQRILQDSDQFLKWLEEVIRKNVPGLDGKSTDEVVKRMVLGLPKKYNFPPAKVLVENLVMELQRVYPIR